MGLAPHPRQGRTGSGGRYGDSGVGRAAKARKPRRGTPKNAAWRPQPYGDRVLVFDTETTTDAAQRLFFGFFRLYERDRLIVEGLIVSDILDYEQMIMLTEYAVHCRLPIYSRERFVEERFYREVYVEGTVCVGFICRSTSRASRFTQGPAVPKIAGSSGLCCRAGFAGTIYGWNPPRDVRPLSGSSPSANSWHGSGRSSPGGSLT